MFFEKIFFALPKNVFEQKNIQNQQKTFLAHLAHLLVHGTLHLQGYDHLTARQAKPMENLEIKIMKKMGYSNPYQNVE